MSRPSTVADTCPSEELLERFVAGNSDAMETPRIDSHVNACPKCRNWLDEARADDALLGDVRAALGNHAAGSSNMVVGDLRVGHDRGLSATSERRPPESIGPYRLVRRLGEGGMGIVFEARQAFPARTVALKVLRAHRTLDDHAVRLFHREAQALARLRHVGIAHIYDAGYTESSGPYLVMEQVAGSPLNEYIRRANPPIKARLELFLQIADAIGYAHQRGVIHRDLKPSNILVQDGENDSRESGQIGTEDPSIPQTLNPSIPHPKLLDFGLSRILDPDVPKDASLTEDGLVRGTLAYMSPEQTIGRAEDVDLRTDVYSLGLILYEMLTARLPYLVRRQDIVESLRTIREAPPVPPSAVDRRLRGDLETIALKALAKEPQRRYQSVPAFADDVSRFLRNEPVLARTTTAAYQLRKLIARHKFPTAAIAAILALVVGFGIWTQILYQQADNARRTAVAAKDDADAKARTSQEVQRFLEDMLSSADPTVAKGRDVTVLREMLDQAETRVATTLGDEPEAAAAIHRAIGNTYMSLGLYAPADKNLSAALDLCLVSFGDMNLQTAESQCDLGQLRRRQGRPAEAEPLYQSALATRQSLLGPMHRDIAEVLNNLAALRASRHRIAEGEAYARRAVEMVRALSGGIPDDGLSVALLNHGTTLVALGRFDEGESAIRESLEIRRNLFGEDDTFRSAGLATLASYLLHFKNDAAGAEPLLREAVAIRRRTLGNDHPDLAASLESLGTALMFQDKNAEAAAVFREALDIHLHSGDANTDDPEFATEHIRYARCLAAAGEADKARGVLDTLIGRLESQPDSPSATLSHARQVLADLNKTTN